MGQIIRLAGVTAPVGLGAEKISVTTADEVAGRIDGLTYAVSPRELPANAEGFSRLNGEKLTKKGNAASRLVIGSKLGRPALVAVNPPAQAALVLPNGSVLPSFSLFIALAISDSAAAGASPANFVNVMNPGATEATDALYSTLIRYYPVNASSVPNRDKFSIMGAAAVPRLGDGWTIVCVDYSQADTRIRYSIDGGEFILGGATFAPNPDAYISIGYTLSTAGLQSFGVGDLYIFDRSLVSTDPGRAQANNLIAQMKANYGIA